MYVSTGQYAAGSVSPNVETFSRVDRETFVRVPGDAAPTVPTVTGPVVPSPAYAMPPMAPVVASPSILDRIRAVPTWALVGGGAAVLLVGALALQRGAAT